MQAMEVDLDREVGAKRYARNRASVTVPRPRTGWKAGEIVCSGYSCTCVIVVPSSMYNVNYVIDRADRV